jgi:hypothetical protein
LRSQQVAKLSTELGIHDRNPAHTSEFYPQLGATALPGRVGAAQSGLFVGVRLVMRLFA